MLITNNVVNRYKDIPVVSHVTQQQVWDNYYQVKKCIFLIRRRQKTFSYTASFESSEMTGEMCL